MIAPNELFALLSDETRLRCLLLLYKKKELCVCEFGYVLESIQPKISRHLAYLRKSGLVLDERRGQWVYYRLNPSLPESFKKIVEITLESLCKQEPYISDIKKVSLQCGNICN
jgi:ArsR family transcriptional regulator, arsenate/arsenite/antimonite-responsive transcriptional repressor